LVVAGLGVFASKSRWAELPDELSQNGRTEVWQVATRVWSEHPLAGSGPGSFKLVLPRVAAAHEQDLFSKWIVTTYEPGAPVTIWMYAHNDPLQTLAEWGVIGALLFGVLLAWPLMSSLRGPARSTMDAAIRVGGVVALGALYLHALIDFPLQVFAIQITAALWAAVLIGPNARTRATRGTPPAREAPANRRLPQRPVPQGAELRNGPGPS
jgi:O-antigen ligase